MNQHQPVELISVIVVVLLFIAGVTIYFLPSMIAIFRSHRNALSVVVLNLFLGWTLVGWVVALVWSLYKEPPAPAPQIQPATTDGNHFGRFD